MHNQLKKDTMIQNHEIDYYKSILPRFLNSRLTFLYLSSQLYSAKQCTTGGILGGQKFRKGCQMGDRAVYSQNQIFYKTRTESEFSFMNLGWFLSGFQEIEQALSGNCVPVSEGFRMKSTFSLTIITNLSRKLDMPGIVGHGHLSPSIIQHNTLKAIWMFSFEKLPPRSTSSSW